MYRIYVSNLLSLTMMYFVTCVSPGPDFVNVTSLALDSRKSGLLAAAGVAIGCGMWSTVAVLGLNFLLLRFGSLEHLIKCIGSLYLAYLGVRSLLGVALHRQTVMKPARIANTWTSLRRGFVTDITNPTLMVFFGSLFATTLPVNAPLWVRCASVFIITFIAGAWHLVIAMIFSVSSARSIYQRIQRPIDAVLGSALILMAIRLVAVD